MLRIVRAAGRQCRPSLIPGVTGLSGQSRASGVIALSQRVIIPMLRNVRAAGRQSLPSPLPGQGGDGMHRFVMFSFLTLVTALSACATMPNGPSVMVLPGDDKNFDEFRVDDTVCRQFAFEQVGGSTGQQAAQDSAVTSAVIGTAIGAVAGAAIGSASGDMGAGAAIGAGSGLLFGSAAGSGASSSSYYENQRRYDNAYMQCMYAKGNQIPGYKRTTRTIRRYSSPPPADYPPPPPPAYKDGQ